jgi:single-strand DNA-binding protein
MASLAKVTLIGNLGRDPETRYTPNGTMNVNFSIATNRRWTDQSGQQQERTTWFRVTGWGRMAETMDKLSQSGALAKGKQVYVSGDIELREYTDAQGQQRSTLDVTAHELQLLGSRTGEPGAGGARADERPEDADAMSRDIEDVPF